MQPITHNARRYDGRTMLLHWLTAFLIASQWLGAQVIDWFPSGPLRVDARSVHIVMGILLAAVLVARLAWRATSGRRLPPGDRGVTGLAAKGIHWALYGLVAAMLLVGVTLAWVRGDSIFNLFAIPSFAPGNKQLSHTIQEIHDTIGWVIIVVASLHASAALAHHFVWHDGVLARMLPGHHE